MRILLITRCGAQQWKNIPDRYPPPIYKIPLTIRIPIALDTPMDEFLPTEVRVFEYKDSSRYGNFAVYEEKP